MYKWTPITDLPSDLRDYSHNNLHSLAEIWTEQHQKLKESNVIEDFLKRLQRSAAIETGIIERLYSIDRGVTRNLIEQGIDEALIPHGTTDKPASQIVKILRDHEEAIEWVLDYVGQQKELSLFFIKSLHQLLTRHQDTTEAIDQFGRLGYVSLLKGDWKKLPNNPTREDDTIHEYCPPEEVLGEMERLVEWHLQHLEAGVSPEVEAAWLHHRFTQIHPFQDGNGRVARLLATLVFLRAGWFPLIVINGSKDQNKARNAYITALEKADNGDLQVLIEILAESQKASFLKSLSLSESVLHETQPVDIALNSIIESLKLSPEQSLIRVQTYAIQLYEIANTKIEELKARIELAINRASDVPVQVSVSIDSATESDERSSYYRFQIIKVAQEFEYFANLSLQNYKRWIRLSIRVNKGEQFSQTELLLSFHHLGRNPEGVMICSAIGFRRYSADMSASQEIEALTTKPFDFTYHDNQQQMRERFKVWLDDFVPIALRYWQNSLT